jgi:putative transposase
MARLPRLVAPGQLHYLVQRGHSNQPVFIDDSDRRDYLRVLHEAALAQQVPVHAYALLDAQVHMLLTPPTQASLGLLMQQVGRRYVSAFNRRHGRSGTLWQGRFRAGVVQAGARALDCMRLVDSLAVRHGLALSHDASHWSSAPHRLGLRRDRLVSDPAEFWRLGNTPFEREVAYRALLAAGLDEGLARQIEHAALNGWALGSPLFLAQLAEQAGRPARPRARGRPPRAAIAP